MPATILIQKLPKLQQIIRIAHERRSDDIEPVLNAKEDILFIRLAHIEHIEVYARQIDALAIRNRAAIHNFRLDFRSGDSFDA